MQVYVLLLAAVACAHRRDPDVDYQYTPEKTADVLSGKPFFIRARVFKPSPPPDAEMKIYVPVNETNRRIRAQKTKKNMRTDIYYSTRAVPAVLTVGVTTTTTTTTTPAPPVPSTTATPPRTTAVPANISTTSPGSEAKTEPETGVWGFDSPSFFQRHGG